jgi:endo-1,4-beta-xylanase
MQNDIEIRWRHRGRAAPAAKERAMRIRHSLLVAALAATALTVTPTAASASSGVDTSHVGQGLGATTTQPSLRILAMRSGLKVGTAVNMDLYGSNAKYTRIVDQQFNTVTAENVMKWQLVEPTQGTYDWAAADRLVAGARADHQLVRGHTLVWHNQLPSWLSTDGTTTSFTPQQVRDLLRKHIVDEVTHFRGQIWQWDVVNEAFNDDGTPRQDIFYKAYQALGLDGLGYIADAFRWAHQADPHALLFYNDYNLEFTGAKSNAVYSFVQQLQAQHVPIAGVGFQGHLDTQYGFPDLQNNLQRFAALGLKVALTEVDVRTFVQPDPANPGTYTDIPLTPALQATQESYWKQTLQACLAVKQCISYTVWGVADSNSWIPGVFTGEGAALLFDDNLNPKPQYQDLRQILWATKAPRRV